MPAAQRATDQSGLRAISTFGKAPGTGRPWPYPGRSAPVSIHQGQQLGDRHKSKSDRTVGDSIRDKNNVTVLHRTACIDDVGNIAFAVLVSGCEAWLRSEEHKSELQSLMSISYAVFC